MRLRTQYRALSLTFWLKPPAALNTSCSCCPRWTCSTIGASSAHGKTRKPSTIHVDSPLTASPNRHLCGLARKWAPIAVCGPYENALTTVAAHYRVYGQLNAMRAMQSVIAQASVELAQHRSTAENFAVTMQLDRITGQLTKLREESHTWRSRASR